MEKQIYFGATVLFALVAIFGGGAEGSFVTKINNGFERIVVSIDDHLALPPSSSLSSSGQATTTGFKGATQECRQTLSQLQVRFNFYIHSDGKLKLYKVT